MTLYLRWIGQKCGIATDYDYISDGHIEPDTRYKVGDHEDCLMCENEDCHAVLVDPERAIPRMDFSREWRIERLNRVIQEKRLLRMSYQQIRDGREYVCLLAAISPEVGVSCRWGECPAHIMPRWMARLTPAIDDAVDGDAWESVILRYARLVNRWHVLTSEAWSDLRFSLFEYLTRYGASAVVWERMKVSESSAIAARNAPRTQRWLKHLRDRYPTNRDFSAAHAVFDIDSFSDMIERVVRREVEQNGEGEYPLGTIQAHWTTIVEWLLEALDEACTKAEAA